jgi:hypothetical protein
MRETKLNPARKTRLVTSKKKKNKTKQNQNPTNQNKSKERNRTVRTSGEAAITVIVAP